MSDMTIVRTKAAWIRDNSVPVGQPAGGYFECACGAKVPCPVYGQVEDVTCVTCGQQYGGHGWIRKTGE